MAERTEEQLQQPYNKAEEMINPLDLTQIKVPHILLGSPPSDETPQAPSSAALQGAVLWDVRCHWYTVQRPFHPE